MITNEEIRCGFVVSAARKEVWRVELEMVKIFIGICDKYGLKYVASGGTLLGAVRHNGFIPWDDDIDLMMPRSDYEKLLSVAQAELPSEFFLQYYKTEKNYINGHTQIRNNKTTCLLRAGGYTDLKSGKNCGIFIDIFPYDDIPDNPKKRQKQARRIEWLKRIANYKIHANKPRSVKSIIKKLICDLYFVFHSLKRIPQKIEKLAQKYNGKTSTVGLMSFVPRCEKTVWNKAWFDDVIYHKFEDVEIAIPLHYDEVLKKQYDDYMQLPENKDNGSMHGSCYFDVENSFTEYMDISQSGYDALFDTPCM